MGKYIYDKSEIQEGDIVEMDHDWEKYNQPIGTISIVKRISGDSVIIADSRDHENAYSGHYVKKIKTKYKGKHYEIRFN